jgi:ATP-dependent Clp protease protease subunit
MFTSQYGDFGHLPGRMGHQNPLAGLIPIVIEKTGSGERSYDIYSRLLKERIIFIGDAIDDYNANAIIAQLLFLHYDSKDKEIAVYINSPGGSVSAGLAIYDTMQFVSSDVATYCIGQAASMGAVLLSAGTKGKRYCLPTSRVMIHQPWGGARGTADDMTITINEMNRLKDKLYQILGEACDKTPDQVRKDSERDLWLPAEKALEYGIVDQVVGQAPSRSDD